MAVWALRLQRCIENKIKEKVDYIFSRGASQRKMSGQKRVSGTGTSEIAGTKTVATRNRVVLMALAFLGPEKKILGHSWGGRLHYRPSRQTSAYTDLSSFQAGRQRDV